FSEPISFSGAGVSVSELVSNTPITPAGFGASGNIANITLPAGLADGIYRVTLPASSVQDSASNAMAAGVVFTFLYVAGGATFVLPPGDVPFAVDHLSIGSAGALDLKDNNLIVHHDSGGSFAAVASGAIKTTMPNAPPPITLTRLGVASATE